MILVMFFFSTSIYSTHFENLSHFEMYFHRDRSWAKPNETLALDSQKFWKKLHRKKLPEIFF